MPVLPFSIIKSQANLSVSLSWATVALLNYQTCANTAELCDHMCISTLDNHHCLLCHFFLIEMTDF